MALCENKLVDSALVGHSFARASAVGGCEIDDQLHHSARAATI